MLNFLAGGGVTPKLAKGAKVFFALFTGFSTGLIWGKVEWAQREDWCNTKSLTQYECEDQINSIIQNTKKPAVIYYYLPMTPYHYLYRAYMLKYSNKYPENATWVMVNLVQHMQEAKQGLRGIIFPSKYRIQVRFPRTQLAIYEQNQKEELVLAKQTVGNRREVYNSDYYETNFEAFLEEHKVIKGADPIMPVLKLTEMALFEE